MENIVNNLMNDKEIIEALNKKFGDNLILDSNGSAIKNISKTNSKPMIRVKKRISSIFSTWTNGTSSDDNLYNSIWYNTIAQCKKNLEDLSINENFDIQDTTNNIKQDIKIHFGEKFTVEKITFQAYLVEVESEIQVKMVFDQLEQDFRFVNATDNFFAFRIIDNESNICERCNAEDDPKVADILLEQLQEMDVKNVLIIVSIWYLGKNFGSDKYRYIRQVINDILFKCDMITK